ncbi:alkaline phosphatase [Caenimonas sp. SL110]|uniref:alkaline phosphatase D family protein n=1 Tax=Caenimonas sp. SL110 TaxID=1450524 RepID=UPI000652B65B|nr:alkaline phosphatase D family protein [Caenimonas sp. SL110]
MAHASPERRRLLQLAAANAATLWLPRSAWSQPRLETDPFALGVASGSPSHDSVVLWTRLMAPSLVQQPVTVRWEIAHDHQFTRIAQRGQVQALPEFAHSVHVEAAGLEADRWYFYRFMTGDATSPVGRTRTFPSPDAQAQRLRLAYASCQRWEHGYYAAWRHMQAENVDVVMFLGDYIYEYATAARAIRTHTGGVTQTLDDYRARHALHKSDTDLQGMHAACPWIVTWDDHEVFNDHAGPQLDPARRAAAYQAFYEHMPLRASALTRALAGLSEGAELRLYSQIPFGRLANLYLLDGRQYRDRQVCSGGNMSGSISLDPARCPEWDDPKRSLLGAAQEAWFDASLARTRPGWNVIGQQSLFGERDLRAGPDRALWNDGWDGYGAARTRLTQSLVRHQAANPVLLGGDVHENWVGHVKADYSRPDSAAVGVEFCGTSITSRSSGQSRIPGWLAENPHFVFADSLGKGYGIAEFTPSRLTTTLRVVDDVTRKDTGIRTLAQFAVQAGRPVVERAG